MVTSVIGKKMEHSSDWNVGEVIHQYEVLFTICRTTPQLARPCMPALLCTSGQKRRG